MICLFVETGSIRLGESWFSCRVLRFSFPLLDNIVYLIIQPIFYFSFICISFSCHISSMSTKFDEWFLFIHSIKYVIHCSIYFLLSKIFLSFLHITIKFLQYILFFCHSSIIFLCLFNSTNSIQKVGLFFIKFLSCIFFTFLFYLSITHFSMFDSQFLDITIKIYQRKFIIHIKFTMFFGGIRYISCCFLFCDCSLHRSCFCRFI